MLITLIGLRTFSPLAAQTVYDPVAQFDPAQNPGANSSPWSYGYKASSATGSFILFDAAQTISDGNHLLNAWYSSSIVNLPHVAANLSSTNTWADGPSNVAPLELNLHPGPSGQFADLRFIAPSSGSYALVGNFSGNSTAGTTSDVHILDNNSEVFGDTVDGYNVVKSFSLTMGLSAGDVVDFAVGYGDNFNYNSDSTGLVLTFTAVPEPANVALLAGLSAVGAGAWVRRRTARSWVLPR